MTCCESCAYIISQASGLYCANGYVDYESMYNDILPDKARISSFYTFIETHLDSCPVLSLPFVPHRTPSNRDDPPTEYHAGKGCHLWNEHERKHTRIMFNETLKFTIACHLTISDPHSFNFCLLQKKYLPVISVLQHNLISEAIMNE